jgi:Ca2+-transporting ATPase
MTVVRGIISDIEYHAGKSEDFSAANSLIMERLDEAISVNSTAFESSSHGENVFIGSKTETALLEFIRKCGFDYTMTRSNATVIDVFPFASERKSMTTVIEAGGPGMVRIHCKGASEIILDTCTSWMRKSGRIEAISPDDQRDLKRQIMDMAQESLRTIAIAYRDMTVSQYEGQKKEGPPLEAMTLIALVGIEDPLRQGVLEAVSTCQKAGIFVRMVTGDNVVTAQSIARKCGILMRGGVVMEGVRFRELSNEALEDVIPRLQVLARSSPLDKQILVRKLKEMGEIVAVTGDGTNDGPALKAANVGFAMGIAGTEVAKEASAIVLLDDNFKSIVKAVAWGRCVNDSVRKFLQFQLTVNVSAVVIAFSSAAFDPQSRSVLSAVQLLWVNLIMDTFAALALATDRPSKGILNRFPEPNHSSLITVKMTKMIIGQAIFQVAAMLTLLYAGHALFRLPNEPASTTILGTIIFNSFVFMQLFNEINCRILNGGLNPFRGLLQNNIFIGIWVGTVIAQVFLVFFGGAAFSTVPISWQMWLISLGIGILSLPIALIIRLLPDWTAKPTGPERIYMSRERLHWQAAIGDVRRSLAFFTALRRAHKPASIEDCGLGGGVGYGL